MTWDNQKWTVVIMCTMAAGLIIIGGILENRAKAQREYFKAADIERTLNGLPPLKKTPEAF